MWDGNRILHLYNIAMNRLIMTLLGSYHKCWVLTKMLWWVGKIVKNTTFVPEAEKSPCWLCAHLGYLLLTLVHTYRRQRPLGTRERWRHLPTSQSAHNVEGSLKRDLLSLDGRSSDTAHETTPSAVLTNFPKWCHQISAMDKRVWKDRLSHNFVRICVRVRTLHKP